MRAAHLTSLVVLAAAVPPAQARAPLTWSIQFDDPGGTFQAYYDPIRSNFLAAAAEWNTHLVTLPTDVSVDVRFTDTVQRSSGHSATTAYVGTAGGANIFSQGVIYKFLTGADAAGVTPDVYLDINPDYLQSQLWFDPDPTARTAIVPGDRLDAQSVFLHELTHAIAFNGWRDGQNGALPGNPPYESTFDFFESFDGSNLFFNGPRAAALYRGPVPITYGNNWHLGNASPRPGTNLIPDLMNGIVFQYGRRYDLSALDLAIARDAGTPSNFIPGDLNGDGTVSFDDLLTLAQNYGRTDATLATGDVNTDWRVDFADLLIVAQNYGQSFQNPQTPTANIVPEPAAWLTLPLLAGAWRRRTSLAALS